MSIRNLYKYRNLLCSILNVGASAFSTLLLLPIIKNSLSIESYGYASVCLSLTNMATIVSVALTSMSARYIIVSMRTGNRDDAARYLNSIFVACAVLASALLVVFLAIARNLGNVMRVEPRMMRQVQITLMVVCGSLCCQIIKSPLCTGLYYRDCLWIDYLFLACAQIARIIFPLIVFPIVGPMLWIPYAGSLVFDFASVIYNLATVKSRLDGVSISPLAFDRGALREVLGSGVWVSISKAGAVLLSTISLYLSNLVLGPTGSGMYSSIQQLSSFLAVFCTAVVGVSVPKMLASYVDDRLANFVSSSFYHGGTFIGAVCGGVTALAVPFMVYWVGQEMTVCSIAIVTLVGAQMFICPFEYLNQAFIAMDRVRVPALWTIGFGVVNVVLTLLLCLGLGMGMEGIVIAQVASVLTRNYIVLLPYSCSKLGIHIHDVIRYQAQPIVTGVVAAACGVVSSTVLGTSSFANLLFCGTLAVGTGLAAGFLIRPREERSLDFWSRDEGSISDAA